jgi:ATP-dependent Clp protease ATP-binding subunit ClpA
VVGQAEAREASSAECDPALACGLRLIRSRPNGSFMFLGPTGVGKTEL